MRLKAGSFLSFNDVIAISSTPKISAVRQRPATLGRFLRYVATTQTRVAFSRSIRPRAAWGEPSCESEMLGGARQFVRKEKDSHQM